VPSDLVIVARVPVTPVPPVGVPLPGGKGGQTVAHVPVQALVPAVSLANVYSVKPAEFTSIVLPRVALLEVRTVALAAATVLVAAELALGVAVAAGVAAGACVAGAAVRAAVGVVVELLLLLQAVPLDKAKSRPVDARSKEKRLFIGLLSVLDGQSLKNYVSRGLSDAAPHRPASVARLRFDTFDYLDNHVPRSTMISNEPRITGRMYS
jgi:hypothetical protein